MTLPKQPLCRRTLHPPLPTLTTHQARFGHPTCVEISPYGARDIPCAPSACGNHRSPWQRTTEPSICPLSPLFAIQANRGRRSPLHRTVSVKAHLKSTTICNNLNKYFNFEVDFASDVSFEPAVRGVKRFHVSKRGGRTCVLFQIPWISASLGRGTPALRRRLPRRGCPARWRCSH